ncbi:MAG: permease prefix domain 1-containing protein, partial [Oscillospiraceae bacterium]|nr:permease prefix domain 1-containing protein [Oscillospiraceae bacterium]
MKEKVYVDRLFADYEDTLDIRDFKEEVTANLVERVKGLAATGLSEDESFEKATAELGDITAIADDAGRKKRNETISQIYMNAKVPITKRTAGGVAAASGVLMIAVGLVLVAFFGQIQSTALYFLSATLLSASAGLYTYFGLTQETAAHYAVSKKRALAYGIICFTGFLGTGLATALFFFTEIEIYITIIVKTIFIIPTICTLVYLLATEPKRQKPWLKAITEREIEDSFNFRQNMVNPAKAAR